jgi:hypothetical protein
MKLRATITVEWTVHDPKHYNAATLEEAARNQQADYDRGDFDCMDILQWGETVTTKITPVGEDAP